MRLAETLLSGYGIAPKTVRPSQVLDIIDGLLLCSDISKATGNINKLYNLDYTGDVSSLNTVANDIVLVKLLSKPKATKLYSRLLLNIMLGTSTELSKEDILGVLGGVTNTNAQYKALTKTVEQINDVLDDTIILYTQYGDKVRFIVLKGNTSEEFKNYLVASGYQSPMILDKLHLALIIKGLA